MVVQFLLRNDGDLPLSDLPEATQARLTRELGALSIIDKKTLNQVIEEFSSELSSIALTAPGSVEAALQSLEGRISPGTVAKLREEAAARAGHDPWKTVLELENEDILPITEAESPEISAILLSKMTTAKAAELLGMMPGARARRIAFSMSRTTKVTPQALGRIGASLAKNYCGVSISAFPDTPESRIGAILNSSSASTRDGILEGLLAEDPTFGEGVRKAIFTFADIPARLAVPDVPKAIREVDQADLVTAIGFAKQEGGDLEAAATFILENMSSRMADNLREEIGERGKIKQSDGETAQTALVTAIRAAASDGTLTLIVPDEDED
ncbi:Flagellar motor switch protein FliG [Pseudooctadecabacter jejudonensis]|uniref:Flagellar motor switch protein FliG n=2 Tax=Pseudooctadecabacter jejudonensis TaxID=1391910 RepID=A0A1Y5TFK9_9RHOB|nr:Flagellar motor switch protein FliG [Pseudooctadecabacter jejudonensis]